MSSPPTAAEAIDPIVIYNPSPDSQFNYEVPNLRSLGYLVEFVIFFNNFDAQNIEEYISKIIGVLAHEVFHFIHNLIITDDKFDKNDENAVILKEALADFFSYSYLIFNQRKRTYHINTARNMFNNWVEYFGSPWKYAYALYFFIINKKYTGFIDDFSQLNTLGIIDKFKDVLYGTNHDNTSISLLKLIN